MEENIKKTSEVVGATLEAYDEDMKIKSSSEDSIHYLDDICKHMHDNKDRWFVKEFLDEYEFTKIYLEKRPLLYYKNFYDINGELNKDYTKKHLNSILSNYVKSAKLLSSVNNILQFLQQESFESSYKPAEKTIHVNNATLVINSKNEVEVKSKEITINRLNVDYIETKKNPTKWLQFLNSILIEEDIDIIQEYLGYCLIATVETQKALFIIGKTGGEGKSTIMNVVQSIFGKSSMTQKSVHNMFESRFGFSRVNNKLIIYDDDMNIFKDSMIEPFKKFVSLDEIEYEAKYESEETINNYSRFIGLGNNVFDNINSNDTAFNRRLMILNVKAKPINRVDNPRLNENLISEKNLIFNWMLKGLIRLIKNKFKFSHSEEMKIRVEEILNNNTDNYIYEFMQDNNFISFEDSSRSTTEELYNVYLYRCEIMGLRCFSFTQFSRDLARVHNIFNLKKMNKVGVYEKRGYEGIYIELNLSETVEC